jgi:hypothetical protein
LPWLVFSPACEATGAETGAKFLGAASCAASGCHGGAGEMHKQFTVWQKLDHHSRAHATLTTARSARMAEALKINDALSDQRCTTCHAPFQDVPASAKAGNLAVSEGVSCESCHGAAEAWHRSHTRKDYTPADRVLAGMRDLENLYVRANTCVACHQQVDQNLLNAGHPELIFELDGQAVSEPKHWRESPSWSGPQAWLVGQAVALRESSWHLSRERAPAESAVARWQALLWLVRTSAGENPDWPSWGPLKTDPSAANLGMVQKAADELAKRAAQSWPSGLNAKLLNKLSGSHAEFTAGGASTGTTARRAELVVLAIERLSLDAIPASPQREAGLKRLFGDVQALPDFNAARFSKHLEEFHKTLATR